MKEPGTWMSGEEFSGGGSGEGTGLACGRDSKEASVAGAQR